MKPATCGSYWELHVIIKKNSRLLYFYLVLQHTVSVFKSTMGNISHFVFSLSTMHSTCLPCPSYLSNCVTVVQRLRSRLHINHRWLILVSCQTATANSWTLKKTEKTLFLFNSVAKMLLVNFTKEQIEWSKCTKCKEPAPDPALWGKATWHRELLCFQAALCTATCIINHSSTGLIHFAAVLYLLAPQFHRIHRGKKKKNPQKIHSHIIFRERILKKW